MTKTLPSIITEIEKTEPFFADLLNRLEIKESSSIATIGTDGNSIMYNQKWLNSLTDEEAKGVIIHEILHLVFLHLYRREKRNQMKFNIACDLAINPILKFDYGYQLPKGVLLERKYYGLSAEKIYDLLPEIKLKMQVWGNHGKWENGKKKQGQGIADKIRQALEGKKEEEEKQGKRSKTAWENIIKNAVNRHRGDIPDSLKRALEEFIFIPETDWREILRYYLSENDKDYTFSVRDRRFLESDFILPGTYSEDRLKDIVVAFDSSGSIDHETLNKFYREFKSILDLFPDLNGWYIVCDCEVHDFGRIESGETLPRFIGGGGTSHSPVFEEIKRRNLNPKLVICFTDLETEFPTQEPPYPVLWLVPSQAGNNRSVEAPFGKVIKIWE